MIGLAIMQRVELGLPERDETVAIRVDLRAVAEDTDDEPALLAWLRLAGTRSADEIATAIRSFRPS